MLSRMSAWSDRLWPLPALVVWALCWAVLWGLRTLGVPTALAVGLAVALGGLGSLGLQRRWRRWCVALGFPLSLVASIASIGGGAAGGVPAWGWLIALLALLALYPLQAWRDAPMFPTPRGALRGLAAHVALPSGDGGAPRVLDAGCGLGDGLRELHAQYPQARLEGLEWSVLLRVMCALRCRLAGVPARVWRGDLWRCDWSPYAMVYLFQRPESMPRAVDKARQEMRPGAWLASLEFEALGLRPDASHRCADGRQLWLYRAPFRPRAAPTARGAGTASGA